MHKKKEVIIEGVRISYIENVVDSTSPVTLFLHGWASSKDSFHLLFPYTQNYIGFDFPGCGDSSSLPCIYTLDDYVNIFSSFMEKVCSPYTLNIVAHSFGGRVLLRWLSWNTEHTFRSVVLTGVPLYRDLSFWQKLQEQIGTAFHSKLLLWSKPFFQKVYRFSFSKSDYAALGNDRTLQKTFQNIVSDDISCHIPILATQNISMIWGENDVSAPISNMHKAKNVLPTATSHSVPHAGHFPWADNTENFVSAFTQTIT